MKLFRERESRLGASLALPILAIGLAAALAGGFLVSCRDDGELKKVFDIESRIKEGAGPRTPEEIRAAIDEYQKEADRTVAASERIGTYYELLATRYLERKMFRDAYDALEKAMRHYPDAAGLYYNAGLSAAYVAKSEGAKGASGVAERDRWFGTSEASYKRALEIRPTHASTLYGLAVLYSFELGRPSEAIPLLTRLLGAETKNADAMLLLARCLYQVGRLEESAHWYETAAKSTAVGAKRSSAEEARAQILRELGGGDGK